MTRQEYNDLIETTIVHLAKPEIEPCADCAARRVELLQEVCALVAKHAGRTCVATVLLSLFACVVRENLGDATMFAVVGSVLARRLADGDEEDDFMNELVRKFKEKFRDN